MSKFFFGCPNKNHLPFSALSIFVVFGILLSGMIFVPSVTLAATAATVSVNFASNVQSGFLGITAVHNGSVYMNPQTSRGMNATNRAELYRRLQASGIKLVRTQTHTWWAARDKWDGTFNWNSTEMNQFYAWCQDMKDMGIDIAITLPYYYLSEITNWGGTNENGQPASMNDVANNISKLSTWASEFVYQLVTVKGFTNVKYAYLFTEPNSTHTEVGNIPAGYTFWSFYKEVVTGIHNKLVADNRRSLIKLIGPNMVGAIGGAIGNTYLDNAVADLNNVIDIYSSHAYDYTTYANWKNYMDNQRSKIASTGKPFWHDEGGPITASNFSSENWGTILGSMSAATINSGTQTINVWQYGQDYYSSAYYLQPDTGFFMDYGCDRFIPENPTPYPTWYALTLLTKYLAGGPNTVAYSTTNSSGVVISAIKNDANQYSFLVVNENTTNADVTVNLSSAINRTLYRYLYDPSVVKPTSTPNLRGYDRTLASVGSSFTDTLPPKSFAIYSSIAGSQYQPTKLGNLASYATLSASSTYSGYPTGGVVDGNTSAFNGWASSGTSGQWLVMDFMGSKTFNKVELYTTSGYVLKDFDIQYWNGSNWVNVSNGQIRGNTAAYVSRRFTPVTSDKIRINCITGDQYGLSRIDELEVYNEPNLATGATATASSTYTGYSAARVTDGNTADFSGWTSNAGCPQWLQLDFGTAKTFKKVELYTTTGYILKDYDIQYWNGSSWVTVSGGQIRNNTSKQVITTFTAVTSQKIRINCITGDQWNLARIEELEVYN